jgi:hypothetical protein
MRPLAVAVTVACVGVFPSTVAGQDIRPLNTPPRLSVDGLLQLLHKTSLRAARWVHLTPRRRDRHSRRRSEPDFDRQWMWRRSSPFAEVPADALPELRGATLLHFAMQVTADDVRAFLTATGIRPDRG